MPEHVRRTVVLLFEKTQLGFAEAIDLKANPVALMLPENRSTPLPRLVPWTDPDPPPPVAENVTVFVALFILILIPLPAVKLKLSSNPVHCIVTPPLVSLQRDGAKGVESSGERLA